MKSGFLFSLLLFLSIANAQKKDDIKDFFWGQNDPARAIVNIPDKWKNESAVIIFKSEDYHFDKSKSIMVQGAVNITYTSSIRKRIKLMDQASVKAFSEFSFNKGFSTAANFKKRKGGVRVGIKIVKPDGAEREVNVAEEAVSMDEGKKVAISNLEVGDIIDFFYHSVEPFQVYINHPFKAEENTLGDEYPIMSMKLTFSTENDFYVNFNTYNGAPELKPTGTKGNRRNYELVANDIEKNDFPRWFYPLVELPCYKFQVYFAKTGKIAEESAFLPEKEDIIKKSVSKEDVLNYYDKRLRALGDLGQIEDFLKKKSFASAEEKVKEVYYFMRHRYYTRYLEAFVVNDTKIMAPFDLYGNYPTLMTDELHFARHYLAFLKDNKIDCDIIVATPRINGSIDQLLIQENAVLILKVNTPNPVYLQLFNPYTNAGQINYELEASDAYAVEFSNKKKITGIKKVKLPSTTYKDNNTSEKMAVQISDDFSSVNFSRESALKGHNKNGVQEDKMYFFDYVDEDYSKYNTTPLMELVKNKKKKEQYTKEFDALKNKLRDKQKEEAKRSAESEFELPIEEYALNIKNTGRYGIDNPFNYNEVGVFKNNLIKKAGENYVFEIGKLIGGQAEIKDKELNRGNNVYLSFPRSFNDEIIFTIPGGYTVSGIDKLNKKVENSTGGFVSSATIEGNQLIIKTHKYYANYFEPGKNWKDMVAFLDAAYQFTQEKVLLKKV